MKRTRLYATLLLSAMLASPLNVVNAGERGRRAESTSQGRDHSQSHGRPGGSTGRPSGGHNSTPRPGGSNQGNHSNPGNGNGHQNHKPSGNNPGHQPAPNRPPQNAHRPPQPPHNHAVPKPPHYGHYGPMGGHYRPQPWRPTPPPPKYHPFHGWPTFHTVLGVSFGATLISTLNYLIAQGYNATNYNGDVYINNVNMLGYTWPYAVLSYNPAGALCASQFNNYSSYADLTLYNRLFQQLCNVYGAPYSNANGIVSWWGPNNQYIRLSYGKGLTPTGEVAFSTTLNFGIY